jgi:hypothetical protein
MGESMDQHTLFRQTLSANLGKTVTPELAAALERAAFFVPERSIDLSQFAPHEYRGIVFAAESFRKIRAELHPLHEAHFAETERARAGQKLNPDYGYMEMAEWRGDLIQFTARKDGALVGNIRAYLFNDLHTGTRGANEDTLYLSPAARHGFTASRFVEYAERCLAQIGVVDAWCDTKILFDDAGNVIRDVGVLLKRRGWAQVANRYHKNLSKE